MVEACGTASLAAPGMSAPTNHFGAADIQLGVKKYHFRPNVQGQNRVCSTQSASVNSPPGLFGGISEIPSTCVDGALINL